jgi:DNA-binding transcriptional LysR family regulator
MQDIDTVDIRLLRLFETIYAVRHITRSGEELGLSQPTISIGLGKLRAHFGDPLFVRTAEGMLPTPRADALIGPVRDVLQALKRISRTELHFNPAIAVHQFRICMTDASHVTLLPAILAQLRQDAPSVQLEAKRIDAGTAEALQSGEADLALGLLPNLETGFYQQTLFHQGWVCLTHPVHPRLASALTLEAYQAEAHISIVSGTGQNLLDEALARFDIRRRILLRLPGFLGLTAMLASSDLVATLPRHIGETLAGIAGLKVHACPFPIADFPVKQHWHARYHHDPANQWLRGLCASLFLKNAI